MEEDELPDWRAELRREHGLAERPAPRRASGPLPEQTDDPADPGSWVAEMLREAGVTRRSVVPHEALSAIQPVKAWSSAAGFDPRQVAANFDAYKLQVDRWHDPARRRLAAVIAAEPYVRAAFHAWPDADATGKRNLIAEVFPRVSETMGRVLRFRPAPLGQGVPLLHCSAYYDERHKTVVLADGLLRDDFCAVLSTIVHEQVHKLQHEMYLRTHWPSSHPLTLEERAVVYYWVREEPRYRQMAAAGIAATLVGEGQATYRRIGREHHAYFVGDYVAEVAERAATR